MKALKLVALFLACRLVWIWIDQCGADIGLGETLPFCLECSGFQSFLRITTLIVSVLRIAILLRSRPDVTQIHQALTYPGQQFRIYWHRIALFVSIVTYPIWIWWVDRNTTIPGPDRIWIFSSSCTYPGLKGSLLWIITLVFIVRSLRILNKS